MAMSTRWPSSPTMRSDHSPSTVILPSSSRPSSTKNATAASRSSKTMPTLSIRRIVMPSSVGTRTIGPAARRCPRVEHMFDERRSIARVTAAFQGSLLGLGDDVRVGQLGASVERTALSRGAWVDLRCGWIAGADALFDRLLRDVPWHAEQRRMYERVVAVPRLLSFFDEDDALPDPAPDAAKRALAPHDADEPGEPLHTAGPCLYRDGADSVA